MAATKPRHRSWWHKKLFTAILAVLAITAPAACANPDFPEGRVFGLNSFVYYAGSDEALSVFAARVNDEPGSEIDSRPIVQNTLLGKKRNGTNLSWAIIDAEDAEFRKHTGFQGVKTILRHAQGAGGSTITMQYVTIRYLTRPEQKDSLLNKFNYKYNEQRPLAEKYEKQLQAGGLTKDEAKDRILTEYANAVPYCRQARGVNAASWSLFGHGVTSKKFTLSKAAILAGALKDPCEYTDRNPDALPGRRAYVLNQMLKRGHITPQQYSKAIAEPITIAKSWPGPRTIANSTEPYLGQLAKDWFQGEFKGGAETRLRAGNLKFYSTIRRGMQAAANQAVNDQLPSSKLAAALVAINANTGEVVALVSRNPGGYAEDQRNMAVAEPRRRGSTAKVFTIAAAVSEKGYTADSTIDCPAEINGYKARGRTKAGTYSLEDATKLSHNTCFLQLINELGPKKVVQVTKNLMRGNEVLIPGSEGPRLDPVPTFTLGTSELTAYQAATAFIPIANQEGRAVKAHLFTRVTQGKQTPWKHVDDAEDPLEPQEARTTFDILVSVGKAGGTGAGLGIPGRRIAMKTGTDETARSNAAVSFIAADQDGLICSAVITHPQGRRFSGATSYDAGQMCQEFFQKVLP